MQLHSVCGVMATGGFASRQYMLTGELAQGKSNPLASIVLGAANKRSGQGHVRSTTNASAANTAVMVATVDTQRVARI